MKNKTEYLLQNIGLDIGYVLKEYVLVAIFILLLPFFLLDIVLEHHLHEQYWGIIHWVIRRFR